MARASGARAPAKAKKAERIANILEELFPEPAIPLEHEDPFTLLVSVVLSAQTTDKKVNEVTPRLFEVGRTPEMLSTLSIGQIHSIIRQVGLAPQKAKALRGLATMILEEFSGVVPRNLGDLERLPGVGHKTAQVVMAQAFGEPAFPVDTHIHRLAARWGLSSGKNVLTTERDLKGIFPRERWNKLHLQIIYFGRRYCPALRHDARTCPICSWAGARDRRARPGQNTIPIIAPSAKVRR